MGMFTTILYERDGVQWETQIKCGWDECERYSLGDTIDRQGDDRYLPDGVYMGYCSPVGGGDIEYDAVVIKDAVVAHVEPLDEDFRWEDVERRLRRQFALWPPGDLRVRVADYKPLPAIPPCTCESCYQSATNRLSSLILNNTMLFDFYCQGAPPQ